MTGVRTFHRDERKGRARWERTSATLPTATDGWLTSLAAAAGELGVAPSKIVPSSAPRPGLPHFCYRSIVGAWPNGPPGSSWRLQVIDISSCSPQPQDSSMARLCCAFLQVGSMERARLKPLREA